MHQRMVDMCGAWKYGGDGNAVELMMARELGCVIVQHMQEKLGFASEAYVMLGHSLSGPGERMVRFDDGKSLRDIEKAFPPHKWQERKRNAEEASIRNAKRSKH